MFKVNNKNIFIVIEYICSKIKSEKIQFCKDDPSNNNVILENKDEFSRWFKNPTNIYLFIVNNRNNSKRCETCSQLTIKTSERLLLTLNVFRISLSPSVSIDDFVQVNVR